MDLKEFFNDKNVKPKQKTEELSTWLLNSLISVNDLITFAKSQKDPIKATCIEAFEYATKNKPELTSKELFLFAIEGLYNKAPRIKWESAKVIGNTASLFPMLLEQAINGLLKNSEHEGTVVRWSSAFALGEIYKLNSKFNKDLATIFDGIIEREEKNSIKKIFLDAINKTKE